jgi:plastocyanin
MGALNGRMRRIGVMGTAILASLAVAVGVAGASGNTVKAVNYSFKPGTITISKGQAVTWKRVEGRHTVTLKDGSFDKTLTKSHSTRSRTFNKRGTFRYYCRFHRSLGMKGKVVVQ